MFEVQDLGLAVMLGGSSSLGVSRAFHRFDMVLGILWWKFKKSYKTPSIVMVVMEATMLDEPT